ncbi:diadenylate cyclase [Peptoniphilus koenoeneniae]|uniref:Diadenylate cyclase n=1 Tax=Peptoniphilus koenoeneniae TaxID=507751 RepID=A0ABU0ATQ5_9FIRM|nr:MULTISPECIES: diadenylate cyclase CdaA [Peptoniphilus]ERT56738.1 TIGR00159 family protein [Peptoniphilus sp. BV3C26]MDQ0274161.1 diadenylate cyclase [Peptoniphilus koenoeneniae]
MNPLLNFFNLIRFRDIIDIIIVAILFYYVMNIIKGTRAEQLSKGIVVLLIVTKLSDALQLYTVKWIFSNIMNFGLIAVLIVFQPELRKGLEFLGRTSSIKNTIQNSFTNVSNTVNEICDAVASLSRQKIGALIVFEKKTGLEDIADTGTRLDSLVSSGIIINIFIPNTPLHDGAVIIKNDRIKAAACFLPLTDNNTLSKELGTRHRAGIGVTERSDALSLIVSEETGSISIAQNGQISRYLDIETLKKVLTDLYTSDIENSKVFNFIKGNESKVEEDER